MAKPELTEAEAREVFLAEDGVTRVRNVQVTRDDESCDDGPVFTWSAQVRVGDDWFDASFHEHYPEFVDISY